MLQLNNDELRCILSSLYAHRHEFEVLGTTETELGNLAYMIKADKQIEAIDRIIAKINDYLGLR